MQLTTFTPCGSNVRNLTGAGICSPCTAGPTRVRRIPSADVLLQRCKPLLTAQTVSATSAGYNSAGTARSRSRQAQAGEQEDDFFSSLPADPYPGHSTELDNFFVEGDQDGFDDSGVTAVGPADEEEVDDFFSNADDLLEDAYEGASNTQAAAVEDDFFSNVAVPDAGNGDAYGDDRQNPAARMGVSDWEASTGARQDWPDYQYQQPSTSRRVGDFDNSWEDERPPRRSRTRTQEEPFSSGGQAWPNTVNPGDLLYRAPARQPAAAAESAFPSSSFTAASTPSSGFASSCFTIGELRQLVEDNQLSMTPPQLVDVLLHSIALEARGMTTRERAQLKEAAQSFVADISPLVAASVHQFEGDDPVKVLQCLTYLEYPDLPLLQALLDASAIAAVHYTAQQLYDLLWVAASSPVLSPSQEFLTHITQLCQPKMHEFVHDQAAGLLHCLVSNNFVPNPAWLQEFMEAVQGQLRAIHPLQTLHMLSALVHTGQVPSPTFLAALDVAITSWDMVALGHQGQLRLLQALAQWKHQPSGVAMDSIVNGTFAGPIPPRGVEAMWLTSLQLHLGAQPSVRHMTDVATLLVSEIQTGSTPADSAQMVLSLATWTQRVPPCTQSVQRTCRMLPVALGSYAPAVLAQESAMQQPQGTTNAAKQMVKLLGALSVLSVELPLTWVEDAANAMAGWKFEGLDAAELSSLLPVLTNSFKYRPTEPWMDLYLPAAAQCLPQAQPHQLAAALQSLVSLGIPLSDDWWQSFSTGLKNSKVLSSCSVEVVSQVAWQVGVLWSQTHEVAGVAAGSTIGTGKGRQGKGRAAAKAEHVLPELIFDVAVSHGSMLDDVALNKLSLGLQLLNVEYAAKWLQRFDVFMEGRDSVVVRAVA